MLSTWVRRRPGFCCTPLPAGPFGPEPGIRLAMTRSVSTGTSLFAMAAIGAVTLAWELTTTLVL